MTVSKSDLSKIIDYIDDAVERAFHKRLEDIYIHLSDRLSKISEEKIQAIQVGLNNVYNQFLELTNGKYLALFDEKKRELEISLGSVEVLEKKLWVQLSDMWDNIEDLKDVSDFREHLNFRNGMRHENRGKEIDQDTLKVLKSEFRKQLIEEVKKEMKNNKEAS